jgi:hypothetical protein
MTRISKAVVSLSKPRVALVGFTAFHLMTVFVNVSMQASCKYPTTCGNALVRVIFHHASSFPIYSLVSMFYKPIMVDDMSGLELACAVFIGVLGGLLNSLLTGWLLYLVTRSVVRCSPRCHSFAFALVVMSTWIACLAFLLNELGGASQALTVLGVIGVVAYATVRAAEAVRRMVKKQRCAEGA